MGHLGVVAEQCRVGGRDHEITAGRYEALVTVTGRAIPGGSVQIGIDHVLISLHLLLALHPAQAVSVALRAGVVAGVTHWFHLHDHPQALVLTGKAPGPRQIRGAAASCSSGRGNVGLGNADVAAAVTRHTFVVDLV